MAEPSKDNKDSKTAGNKAIEEFAAALSNESRMLVALKSQLYDNSWDPMLEDLRNRLSGKPYIFKLASRIEDDIKRIEQMAEFEAKHKIDLSDFVDIT